MMNGELKALFGMAMIVLTYGIYMTCSPDPGDGQIMLAVVTPITVIVTGVVTKQILYRKLKTNG